MFNIEPLYLLWLCSHTSLDAHKSGLANPAKLFDCLPHVWVSDFFFLAASDHTDFTLLSDVSDYFEVPSVTITEKKGGQKYSNETQVGI